MKIFSITKKGNIKKSIVLFMVSIENLKTLIYHTFFNSLTLISYNINSFYSFAESVKLKMKNYLNKNQLIY